MKISDKDLALRIYIILAALFIASLVTANLIFKKFVSIDFFGWYTFKISVGVLPYPITFLITDTISEIYGKQKAKWVVTAGIFASIFTLLIVLVANALPAYADSPLDDDLFNEAFGATGIAVGASMLAYLLAQYIDVSVFHFWKRLTKGKHLWLRNNFSTFTSQLVDTAAVVGLLCIFGELAWKDFWTLLLSGFLFKSLVALADTPILYAVVYAFKKRFKLQANEEISWYRDDSENT
ncbi:queuosine precursor transporter [Psychroflexus planctonicus]|uniref:Probable queuosine precursor transporter n=1 Tax=Psychroflexus planctonicus TaxID=1526575 RepID=A0ABQ1SIT1_9FLAO|nr:queuosine precursor transporter [Psychroflexus planctonicus]GGE36849.1 hypothetical protein GCM10010832_16290 [Psychroflexus planctonicus]